MKLIYDNKKSHWASNAIFYIWMIQNQKIFAEIVNNWKTEKKGRGGFAEKGKSYQYLKGKRLRPRSYPCRRKAASPGAKYGADTGGLLSYHFRRRARQRKSISLLFANPPDFDSIGWVYALLPWKLYSFHEKIHAQSTAFVFKILTRTILNGIILFIGLNLLSQKEKTIWK